MILCWSFPIIALTQLYNALKVMTGRKCQNVHKAKMHKKPKCTECQSSQNAKMEKVLKITLNQHFKKVNQMIKKKLQKIPKLAKALTKYTKAQIT